MSDVLGHAYPQLSDDGFIQTISQPRPGTEKYFFSHNLCDPTSWYSNSTLVSSFEMTDSGNLTLWNTDGTHENWIDIKHGRIMGEDEVLSSSPQYEVIVEVSTDNGQTWIEKTENTWRDTDGDYDINYVAGEIIFNSALDSGSRVRATFYKASENYEWRISPDAGKVLKVLYVELQFTKDVDFNNIVDYEIWAYNPEDLPNKMLYGKRTYKRIFDFFQESTGPYPVIPAFGGASAGVSSDVITLPFKYLAYRALKSSEGAEVRMKLRNPGALGGQHANVTFYCLTEPE